MSARYIINEPQLLTVAEDYGRRQILKQLKEMIIPSKYKRIHSSFKIINNIVFFSRR